jgi:ribonuclease T
VGTLSETFISVDIESDGPIPGDYSMLQIGASVIGTDEKFEVKLAPISDRYDPEALAVSGLNREILTRKGQAPERAMRLFTSFVYGTCKDTKPVYVGFNGMYDWMFTHWYFIHFLAHDPFGHGGLEMKSYYMGKHRLPTWDATRSSQWPRSYGLDNPSHNAVDDALHQGWAFEMLR